MKRIVNEMEGRKKVLLFLEQNPTIFLHKDEAILLEGMIDELWSAWYSL